MRAPAPVPVFLLGAAILLAPLAAAAQNPLETPVLRERGMDAYRGLPPALGPEHARHFAYALDHLFAYEQRLFREGRTPNTLDTEIMRWFNERFEDDFNDPKADVVRTRHRSDPDLLKKGRDQVISLKRQARDGTIWDVKGYISASANLFAYLQVARQPNRNARADYRWLQENAGLLAVAGAKADDFGPTDWIPRSPRPGGLPAPTTGPIIMQQVPQEVVPSRPAPADSGTDSLRSQLAAAHAELDELRSRVRDLEALVERQRAQLAMARRALAERENPADAATSLLAEARELLAAGRWPEARDAARGALRANASLAAAHLMIARAYAQAAAAGGDRPLDRAVYWLAADHVLRARTLALETETARIDGMLRDLTRRAPTEHDKARMGWRDGQRLRINFEPYGWINEVVVVR